MYLFLRLGKRSRYAASCVHLLTCSSVFFPLREKKRREREKERHTSHCSPTHLQVEKKRWLSALSYVELQTSLWSEHTERCVYQRLWCLIHVGVYSVTRVFLPWKQFLAFNWCCCSNNALVPLTNREPYKHCALSALGKLCLRIISQGLSRPKLDMRKKESMDFYT